MSDLNETNVQETSASADKPTTDAADTTASKEAVSDGAGGSWLDQLPPELKQAESLKKYTSVEQLAKGYVNAQKVIGKDKIVVPDKHATDEDYRKIYEKLGLPESVDKYEVDLGEGVDPDFAKGFKETAHSVGILPKQAEKLVAWYNEKAGAMAEEVGKRTVQSTLEAVDGLKKEYGRAYDENVAKAKAVLKKYGDESLLKTLDEVKIGDVAMSSHPAIVKFMVKLANETMKEGMFKGETHYSNNLSPDAARKKAMGIIGNTKHPYHIKSHPSHQAAVDEVRELFEISG